MKISATKTGYTLKLSEQETLDLAAFIGQLTGRHGLNWYDQIASAVEGQHLYETTDVYGETVERYETISALTAASGSDEKAQDLVHEITVRQLQINKGHYKAIA